MPARVVGQPSPPAAPRTVPAPGSGTTSVTTPPGAGVVTASTDGFAGPHGPGGMGPLSGTAGPVAMTGAAAQRVDLDDGLFLTASGYFVDRPGAEKPATAAQLGDVLARVAERANAGANVFARRGVTVAHKQAALEKLQEALALGADPARFSGSADQALETRASAAPLLLDLAQSLDPSTPGEKALQDQVLAAYQKALDAEPHGLLRTFMLFDLDRAKGHLPEALRPQIDRQMREVAPLSPPYEEWFKGGNTTLKLDYYVGAGFWEEEVSAYVARGFAKTENPDGTVTLKRHYDEQRELNDGRTERYQTDVELVMHDGPEGMFQHMNDPGVAGVVYSGHANYGREVPSHLGAAPQLNGAKVFFALQCGGKGVHNALLEKFPDLHVVASKNSSYGYQDRATLLNTLEGVARRLPWSQISGQNDRTNSSNYYFPSDTLISRRAQDRDGDGNTDAWDRVLSVSAFHPRDDLGRQLTPTEPGRPARALDGHAVTGAVLRFWRMAGYNTWAEPWENQGVLARGFFDGKRSDPLFKTRELTGEDGQPVLELTVNSQYAHAGEEVLGAAMHYELGALAARKAGLSEPDAKAAGLLMAAKALDVDNGYDDEAAWSALLRFAGLPASIRFSDAMAANHADETYPAGSPSTLELFKKSLADQHIDLKRPAR